MVDAARGLSAAWHLGRRFFSSLAAKALSADELARVESLLSEPELALFRRMSVADQRHSVSVEARAARAGVRAEAQAAALLHDIGKLDAALGTYGRVAGTLARSVLGRARVARRASAPGIVGRIGRYVDHAARGEALLREAGARDLVATWAGDHHRRPFAYRVPIETGRALSKADHD